GLPQSRQVKVLSAYAMLKSSPWTLSWSRTESATSVPRRNHAEGRTRQGHHERRHRGSSLRNHWSHTTTNGPQKRGCCPSRHGAPGSVTRGTTVLQLWQRLRRRGQADGEGSWRWATTCVRSAPAANAGRRSTERTPCPSSARSQNAPGLAI